MSTRTTLRPTTVCPNPNASPVTGEMNVNLNTAPTILQSLTTLSYTFTWSGTSPVGTLYLQGSNDYSLNAAGGIANTGTWNNLEITVNGVPASSLSISGNTGSGAIDVAKTGFYATRLFYDAYSGEGYMVCVVNGKVG